VTGDLAHWLVHRRINGPSVPSRTFFSPLKKRARSGLTVERLPAPSLPPIPVVWKDRRRPSPRRSVFWIPFASSSGVVCDHGLSQTHFRLPVGH